MPAKGTDDFDADEFDGDDWANDSDSETTMPCPHCGKEIYDDAERCPHCEQYLSAEDEPAGRKSWLILIGTAICLYIVYHWLVG